MHRLDVEGVVVVVRGAGLRTCHAQCVRRDTPLKDIGKCQSCARRVARLYAIRADCHPSDPVPHGTRSREQRTVFTIPIHRSPSGNSRRAVLYLVVHPSNTMSILRAMRSYGARPLLLGGALLGIVIV